MSTNGATVDTHDLLSRYMTQVARVESGTLDSNENKRVRKRVLMKIGAMKKQLTTLGIPIPTSKLKAPVATIPTETNGNVVSTATVPTSKDDLTQRPKKRARVSGTAVKESVDNACQEDSDSQSVFTDAVSIQASTFQVLESIPGGQDAGLSKSQRKKRILKLNQQLAALAQRKQLRQAQKVFTKAARKKLVDAHTYSNMMNAHVRCGDIEGAAKVFERMQMTGIRPSVVHYTIYLKGVCAAGDMDMADTLLATMETETSTSPGKPPHASAKVNLRTANTYLRGCLRTGATARAIRLWDRLETHAAWKGCSPDSAAFETITALMSHAMMLCGLQQLLGGIRAVKPPGAGRGVTKGGDAAAAPARNPALYLSYARAAALVGAWAAATEGLLWAAHEMQTDDFLIHAKAGGDTEGAPAPPSDRKELLEHVRDSVTARRAAREKMRSMRQFARHRHDELNREWHRINDFVEEYGKLGSEEGTFLRDEPVDQGDHTQPAGDGIVFAKRQRSALMKHFRGLLPFYSGDSDASSMHASGVSSQEDSTDDTRTAKGVAPLILQTLQHSFGLERVARCDDSILVEMQLYLSRLFVSRDHTSSNVLNVSELFPAGDSVHAREKSIMLEIGSGNGEWIAGQAAHDTGKRSNWISLEQRHDRVYTCFTHKVFNDLDNLCVMGGDAATVLGSHFGSDMVDGIFINHPEPPERTGGVDDSQGGHLLTLEFFRTMKRVLKLPRQRYKGDKIRQGFLTIVTDSLPYGKSLVATAREAGFVSKHGSRLATGTESSAVTTTPTVERNDASTADARAKKLSTDVRSAAKGCKENGHFIGRSIYDDSPTPRPARDKHESADGESASLYALDDNDADTGNAEESRADEVGVWRDGAVELHAGTPGEESGHVVEASSYFDRLWTEGSKTKRYYLCVVPDRATVCTSGLTVTPRGSLPVSLCVHDTGGLPGAEHRNKRKAKEVRM
eukprot:m.1640049 g.1640049  ORF g.1640049 m.1640049 type:complete len:963 (+) comp39393_c0_seq1:283-3171(+)